MYKGVAYLFKYAYKTQKGYIVLSILYQIIVSMIPLSDIIIPKYIIDELMNQKRPGYLFTLILSLVIINAVGGSLSTYLDNKCFILKGKIFVEFQAMLTERLSMCDFERLEDSNFLDVKEKARKFLYADGEGFGAVLDNAFNIIGKVFVFGGIIWVLFHFDIWVVFLFVFLVLLNTFYEAKLKKRFVEFEMKKAPIERRTNYLISIIEDFNYGKEIRSYGIKDWLVNKVRFHLNESQEFYKKQLNENAKGRYFAYITGFIREGVTYGYLSYLVIQSIISIGDFSMYVSAMFNFSSSMKAVMNSFLELKQFEGYYDALSEYINIPIQLNSGNLKVPNGPYEIEFKNVSFRYPGQKTWALKDINIKISGSQRLAIVGENGAGKTTFVKLLTRLYDPTEGEILLCGKDIRNYDYASYLSIFSSVFQDYKLFSFSIKENVCFDMADVTSDSDVEHVLNTSGFSTRLKNLPAGVNSFVFRNFEETGFNPSGGEGQKIAIARALYKNAPIIILDEPTAALDPRSEYDIYQNFYQMVSGKMAFFISHRMATTKFCDRVAVFSQGKIVEVGTHNELMQQQDGVYKEFYNMQAQSFKE